MPFLALLIPALGRLFASFGAWLVPALVNGLAPLLIGLGSATVTAVALDQIIKPFITDANNAVNGASNIPIWAYIITTTHVLSLFTAFASAYVTGLMIKTTSATLQKLTVK